MRPIRQILTFVIELIVWCFLCIFQLDFNALRSWETAQKKLDEQPMWVFVLFFCLMVVMAADQLKKTKNTAASFWGDAGLESFFAIPRKLGMLWLLVAVTATGIGLKIAESLDRYYFTQDDNFSQFMPGILVGCRAVWDGHFANWNPYQMLGAPLADVGTYALTYPLTYLSYGVARNWFQDERLVVEVFCWLHLLLASAATYLLARKMRLWEPMAAAVAVCFSLCGYSLIAGRSWYYMTPTMFWFPVLLWLALEFSPSTAMWTWTAATAISIGLFYHAGNVQMWVYGVGFWGLVLLLRKVRESWSWREFATCLPALLIGIGIAVPLLIPQWKATQGLERGTGGEGIERGLMSLLYPNPLVNSGLPNGWGTDTGAPGGQLYYAGTFFTLAWIAGLAVVAAGRDGLKAFRGNPFLSASVVALLLALGSKGGLWILHMKLPVLQAFAHPIKFLPFLQLFSLVLGGLILQRAFAGTARTTVAGVGMFAVATLVMFYHASISSQAFYVWKDRPDSQVPAQMLKEIGQQRIYPLAPWRSPGSGYSKSLVHNFASVEQVQSIEGYEPLWRNKKPYSDISDAMVDDLAMVLRRYGVSLLVVHSSAEKPLLSQNKGVNGNEQLPVGWVKQAMGTVDGEAIFKDDAIALYKVGKAEPLARNEKNGQAIPLRVEGNSVVVDTSSMGGAETIMVNYFWRPGIVAKAGPQILEMGRDQFSRLLIKVPAGVGRVEVSYEVAWRDSLLVGMAVVGLGLLMGWKLLAKA